MEEKTSGSLYGGSLIVPSVQELAKKPITAIPPRYIQPHHPEQQDHVMFNPDHDHAEMPFIDMQKLLSQESTDSESELARLHFACKEWGFFQLVNHGVSSSLVDKVKTESQDFFNLAMEDKKKLWQTPGDVEGFGQAFVVSEDQKLDWADIFFMTTLPVEMRRPHLFPNVPSPFRETLEVYSLELKNLAMTILSQMETALQMEAKEVTKLFEDGMQSMRMNYYPPCPLPAEVIGLTPHSDSIQTNGIYRSIEHRATVNSAKERLSIATFHNPALDGEIGPASSLVTEQTPAVYKRVGVQDYLKALFERKLQAKSFLDELRIK
ncbi:hypothetical protein GBA52_013627 [Prunus armeniaca]|nr:hypothetical protein GBA52_013627 [Prunus armeniaca]